MNLRDQLGTAYRDAKFHAWLESPEGTEVHTLATDGNITLALRLAVCEGRREACAEARERENKRTNHECATMS